MGHQLGSHHTFSALTGSCGNPGEFNQAHAMESGSGSTVMSYLGGCSPNAILAFEALKTGTVGISGSTGGILGRNLIALRNLIHRSLVEVRLEAGLHHRESVALSELVEEAGLTAAMEARARDLQLTVTPVEPGVVIDVDRELIAAALANLLQNAFEFSRPDGHVVLRTDTATAERVRIEVEDECGGLPPGRGRRPVPAIRPTQHRS
jgi:hypothetical protein